MIFLAKNSGPRLFVQLDSADHTTACLLWISKNGAPYAAGVGTVSNGGLATPTQCLYQIDLDPADTDTPGYLGLGFIQGSATRNLPEPAYVSATVPGDPGELTNPERNAVAAALLGYTNGVDIGVSPAYALCAMAAILAGTTTTLGSTTTFRNWAGTKNRVTVVTSPGGRVTVTFDFS